MKRFLKVLICLLLLLACCLGVIVVDNTTVSLEKVDYYSENLPSQFFGYRLMLIADFHNSFYFNQVAKYIEEEHPDAVLFLGDMTALSSDNWDNTLRLLCAIDDSIPVYGVQGNHESQRPDDTQMMRDLKKYGMQMLDNNKVTLSIGGATIDLIGVNDVAEDDATVEGSWMMDELRVYLENVINEKTFTLLACHRANLYPLLNDLEADLMLSGHVHGGVVRLPKVGGLFNVDGTLFPDYDKGFYHEGEMSMYVSSGCDFDILKPRLFNGPSVTLLTLKR